MPSIQGKQKNCLKLNTKNMMQIINQSHHKVSSILNTLIATGYMVPPTSKLPFLNIITDVLLIQVPENNKRRNKKNPIKISGYNQDHFYFYHFFFNFRAKYSCKTKCYFKRV